MKVLVTDAALRTALYVIRSLGRQNVDITATETRMNIFSNPGFASRYVKRRAIVADPIYNEDAYIEGLLKLCRGHDVLLPVSMYSIKAVSKHLDEFRKIIRVPIADHAKIMQVNSTDTAIKTAISSGIPIPKSYFIDELSQLDQIAEELEYPAFIKVKDELELAPSQRHKAVFSREDFISKYYTLHSYQPFPIVQEFIKGDGAAYFALFDESATLKAEFGHRRIREFPLNGGPSTYCESYNNPVMFEHGRKFLSHVKWQGLAMVEFKLDTRDGTPRFMEVNPRVWGSMPLAMESGVDFPYLWAKTAMGEDFKPVTDFKTGVKVRFFFSDIRAASTSLLNLKHIKKYFLGCLIDLFDRKIKDGIFSSSDLLPWIIYHTKSILIMFGYLKQADSEIRFDIHVHSKYSYDSVSEPKDVVRAAKAGRAQSGGRDRP